METSRFCPMRKARSVAYKSTIGFQSGSNTTTLLAAVRFIPSPPTLVVSKNTAMSFLSVVLLNWYIRSARFSTETSPSMRIEAIGVGSDLKISSITDNTFFVYEKRRILWPWFSSRHSVRKRMRTISLPDISHLWKDAMTSVYYSFMYERYTSNCLIDLVFRFFYAANDTACF